MLNLVVAGIKSPDPKRKCYYNNLFVTEKMDDCYNY